MSIVISVHVCNHISFISKNETLKNSLLKSFTYIIHINTYFHYLLCKCSILNESLNLAFIL